jgi:ankyrin repeat protein
MVKLLLSTPGIDPNICTHDGFSPLMSAITTRQPTIARVLIRSPAVDVNCAVGDLVCAVGLAVRTGQRSVLAALLERADVNLRLTDDRGATFAHLAVMQRKPEALALLLRSGEIDVNADDGDTALGYACLAGSLAMVEALVRCPGIDLNRVGRRGRAPIHTTVAYHHTEIFLALVKQPALNVNLRSTFEGLVLHALVAQNEVESVSALCARPELDIGARVPDRPDGATPLIIASQRGFIRIVALLLPRKPLDCREARVIARAAGFAQCAAILEGAAESSPRWGWCAAVWEWVTKAVKWK